MLKVISCPDGDWTVVKIGNMIVYEGHNSWNPLVDSICYQCDIEVQHITISNKDMEENNY